MTSSLLRSWALRAWNTLLPGRAEDELARELHAHLALIEDEHRRRGLAPDAARRAARLALGGLEQAKEQHRRARTFRWVDDLGRDATYAIRLLRRRPITTITSILSLAIGLGLNAAVFSVVDWVLLRPLPYPASHELVHVFTGGRAPASGPSGLTHDEFRMMSGAAAFRESTAFTDTTRVLTAPGIEPAYVLIARVAGDVFRTLGIRVEIGRAFTRQEVESGMPVVVIGHALWRRQFVSDPQIAGRTVSIDGAPHTVVGVMPAGRGYPREAEVWRPLTPVERTSDDRELSMVARLHATVTSASATSEVAALAQRTSIGARTAWVDDVQRTDAASVTASLQVLLAAALLTLLLACANVAALVGARVSERAGEMAVRGALGATRSRILGQLITESVVLAAAGGALGLLLGRWALDVLVAMAPVSVPRLAEVSLDGRIVAIGLMATLATGLAVGLAPSLQLVRLTPTSMLTRLTWPRATAQGGGRRLLVLGQVAVAVILATGAGLLMRSLHHLVTLDHGFAPDRLVAIRVFPPRSYDGDVSQLFRELSAASKSVSGVDAVAWAMRLPTQVTGIRAAVTVLGESPQDGRAIWRPVSLSYFKTVGIPVATGRSFVEDDHERGASGVAIVNEAFVRDFLGGRSPIGTRLRASLADRPLSVVGVAGDVTPAGERDLPALYVPVEQAPIGDGQILVRTRTNPESVVLELKERLSRIAPGLPFDRVEPVAAALEQSRAVTRFLTQVAATFAGLALLLSMIGVYGLASADVSTRWRETAIRLALGASRRRTLWTVIRPSAIVVAAGTLLGVVGAVSVGPALASFLHGVVPTTVSNLAGAPILLSSVGMVAALTAAVRVLRTDPAETLRGE
jgi:putative ABC transport system permease protein